MLLDILLTLAIPPMVFLTLISTIALAQIVLGIAIETGLFVKSLFDR